MVIDCSPVRWGIAIERYGESIYQTLLSGTVAFINAHLSLSADNVVAVIAANSALKDPLLSISDQSTENPDFTSYTLQKLQDALHISAVSPNDSSATHLSPALAIAFCHINRLKHDYANEGRILIVSLGGEFGVERNNLMNIFFAAHKHDIIVDVANIGKSNPILHQACDVTGGVHIEITEPNCFFQKLLIYCLGSSSVRAVFSKPDNSIVDYRAICHCHGKPVNIGYVCSVCLSVKCQFSPICSVCNTVYKIGALRSRKRRKEE